MSGRHRPRLWTVSDLAPGKAVMLPAGQAHHLRTVLRLGPGTEVAAFNRRDGEWLCRIGETSDPRNAIPGRPAAKAAVPGTGGRPSGDRMTVLVERQLRPAAAEPDLWLLFAPIKRARLDWLVERATELGASALLPVWTRHTQSERLNLDRLRAHAIAAAEQSERLSVPELFPPRTLAAVLAEWPVERRLFVCDETGAGEPVGSAAARLGSGPTAFLIGPEGGFDETELDRLAKLSFVTRVGLGPRVLRADTAAVAGLSAFQAIAGDWRCIRRR